MKEGFVMKDIKHSSAFQRLIKEKKSFIIPATLFFIGFYLMLPLSIAFFPEIMNRRVYHMFTWAWVFSLAQFIMIWVLGMIYFYKAKRYDRLVEEIKRSKE